MRIYGELEPSRDGKVVFKRAVSIASIYGGIDIPDVPLGKPNISSPVIASYISGSLGADTIAHLRVIDHNIVSLKSIIKTLSYFNVNKIIFLRGDPPQQGDVCGSRWEPEDAIVYAGRYGVEGGLLLSLRKSIEEILARLNVGAPAYYVMRYDSSDKSKDKLNKIVKNKENSVIGVYLVARTGRNASFLERIGLPSLQEDAITRETEYLLESMGVDRIIISAPGDGWAVARIGIRLAEVGLLE